MPVFFAKELEGVTTFWRIYRADGIAHGLISHDRSLEFDGMKHLAAPGMLPSAIRKSSQLELDSAGVEGALSHQSISQRDLELGLFDEAQIDIGIVDWETLARAVLFTGSLGEVSHDKDGFTAELRSSKSLLDRDLVPRTSPTCRAEFCGPGCNLSAKAFSSRRTITSVDFMANAVAISGVGAANALDAQVRLLEGSQLGQKFSVIGESGGLMVLDRPLSVDTRPGIAVEWRDGCDHTLATCHSRFSNAINFRGEPFLPGNDVLARYASPQ